MASSALGLDTFNVSFESNDKHRKSISVERTFSCVSEPHQFYEKLNELTERLAESLEAKNLQGKNLTLKLKLTNFQVKNGSITLKQSIYKADDLFYHSCQILRKMLPLKVRLIGVRLGQLTSISSQKNHESIIKVTPFKCYFRSGVVLAKEDNEREK